MKSPTWVHVIFVSIFLSLTACGGGGGGQAAAPVATDTPEPQTFSSTADGQFSVPVSFTYGPEWQVQVQPNLIELVYAGQPPAPESEWKGTSIARIDGAMVIDPQYAVSPEAATPDPSSLHRLAQGPVRLLLLDPRRQGRRRSDGPDYRGPDRLANDCPDSRDASAVLA